MKARPYRPFTISRCQNSDPFTVFRKAYDVHLPSINLRGRLGLPVLWVEYEGPVWWVLIGHRRLMYWIKTRWRRHISHRAEWRAIKAECAAARAARLSH